MTRREEIIQAANNYKTHFPDGFINEFIYIDGAEWADRTMLDKVCEWLKSYRQDTNDGTGYIAGIVNDKTIEDLRKAMEE